MMKIQRWGKILVFAAAALSVFSAAEAEDTMLNRLFFKDFEKIGGAVIENPVKSMLIAGGVAALAIPFVNNDRYFADEIKGKKNGFNDAFFNIANYAGDAVYVIAANSLLFLGGEKEKRTAERVIETVAIAGAVNYLIKVSAGRVRPSDTGTPYEFKPFSFNTSMPSGHTAVAFSWATIIGDAYDIGYITYPVAFLCGLARIYKNAHWPSDVLIGGFIGTVVAKIISSGKINENVEVSFGFGRGLIKTGVNFYL